VGGLITSGSVGSARFSLQAAPWTVGTATLALPTTQGGTISAADAETVARELLGDRDMVVDGKTWVSFRHGTESGEHEPLLFGRIGHRDGSLFEVNLPTLVLQAAAQAAGREIDMAALAQEFPLTFTAGSTRSYQLYLGFMQDEDDATRFSIGGLRVLLKDGTLFAEGEYGASGLRLDAGLAFAPAVVARLVQRNPWMEGLVDERGGAAFAFQIEGSLARPSVSIDAVFAESLKAAAAGRPVEPYRSGPRPPIDMVLPDIGGFNLW